MNLGVSALTCRRILMIRWSSAPDTAHASQLSSDTSKQKRVKRTNAHSTERKMRWICVESPPYASANALTTPLSMSLMSHHRYAELRQCISTVVAVIMSGDNDAAAIDPQSKVWPMDGLANPLKPAFTPFG